MMQTPSHHQKYQKLSSINPTLQCVLTTKPAESIAYLPNTNLIVVEKCQFQVCGTKVGNSERESIGGCTSFNSLELLRVMKCEGTHLKITHKNASK